MKQIFHLDDDIRASMPVVWQKFKKFEGITIQISLVIYAESLRWIYEEIDNSTDFVTYARFMGQNNIVQNYPWAMEGISKAIFSGM